MLSLLHPLAMIVHYQIFWCVEDRSLRFVIRRRFGSLGPDCRQPGCSSLVRALQSGVPSRTRTRFEGNERSRHVGWGDRLEERFHTHVPVKCSASACCAGLEPLCQIRIPPSGCGAWPYARGPSIVRPNASVLNALVATPEDLRFGWADGERERLWHGGLRLR